MQIGFSIGTNLGLGIGAGSVIGTGYDAKRKNEEIY